MTDRKPGWLRKLRIDRVDRVGAGANPDAHITLFKRAEPTLEVFEKRAEPERDAAGEVVPVCKIEDEASLDGFLSMIRQAWRETNPPKRDAAGDCVDYPYVEAVYPNYVIACIGGDTFKVPYMTDGDAVTFGDRTKVEAKVTYVAVDKTTHKEAPVADNPTPSAEDIAALEAHVAAEVTKAIDTFKTELAELAKADSEPEPEDVLKSLPDEIRKMVEDTKAEAAEAIAKADRLEKAARVDMFAKAAKAVSLTAVDAATLDAIEKTNSDAYETLYKALETAQARMAESDLFGEFGTGGDGAAGDANEKLETLAKARASEKGVEFHAAYAEVLRENRDLAAEALRA